MMGETTYLTKLGKENPSLKICEKYIVYTSWIHGFHFYFRTSPFENQNTCCMPMSQVKMVTWDNLTRQFKSYKG
jgi:hypothetical protein